MPPESPSQAREALEKSLSLDKKGSWIGSIKRALQSSALQAKAAVDSLRGRPDDYIELEDALHTFPQPDVHRSKTWTPTFSRANHGHEHGHSHDRADSKASTSTLTLKRLTRRSDSKASTSTSQTKTERHHGITPRTAIASLRQHLPHRHSTQSKRDSVFETFRPSLDVVIRAGVPDGFAERGGCGDDGHDDDGDGAIEVPLPSSPINIVPPPAPLKLDLEPVRLVETFARFGRSPEKTAHEKGGVVLGAPPAYETPFRFPPKEVPARIHPALRSPTEMAATNPFDDPPPTNPMPGTTLELELDGHKRSPQRHVSALTVDTVDAELAPEAATMPPLCRATKSDSISSLSYDSVRREFARAQNEALDAGAPFVLSAFSQEDEALFGAAFSVSTGTLQGKHDTAESAKCERAAAPPSSAENANSSGPPSPTRSVDLPFRPKLSAKKPAPSYNSTVFKPKLDQLGAQRFGTIWPGSDETLRKKYSPSGKTVLALESNNPFAALFCEPTDHGSSSSSSSSSSSCKHEDSAPGEVLLRRTFSTWLDACYVPLPDSPSKAISIDSLPVGRPSMDSSVESVYGDSSPVRMTTPSMGDRLQFEFGRSQRNTRYNALQGDCAVGLGAEGRDGEEEKGEKVSGANAGEELRLAEFGNAGPGSVSPKKVGKIRGARKSEIEE